MPQPPEHESPTTLESRQSKIDFAAVEFPSDVLSVKRLRTIFPELFEQGRLKDGFGHFFYPIGGENPGHLVRLNDLLSAERMVAEYTFVRALETNPNEILDAECHECADLARKELEPLYQEFKLADSPETARLLIRHVAEQGEQQGVRAKCCIR
ncbi:unnamed protein product [Gemmata massiliana]|uniref:Uncharacterized protein n=1 Tax=Gemmata massiliana TaxID=1210884 RepID=A0A6P2CWY7_9BACT|nr:hypothetical protein [Gemmata massiliana]VTR93413.1 unnamed protein product [Gemmata massiliana]